jgi:hypothetical protein
MDFGRRLLGDEDAGSAFNANGAIETVTTENAGRALHHYQMWKA